MFTGIYQQLPRFSCIVSARKYATQRVTISSILHNDAYSGCEVIVEGWARSVRKMKDIMFIDLSDGTGETTSRLQVIANKTMVSDLTAGCSLRVLGHVTRVQQQLELQANTISVLGRSLSNMPVLPRKEYSNEYLRQHLHLRHRTNKFAAVARLRDRATRLVHEYMTEREFLLVHTPVLTGNDCEGAGDAFALQQAECESARLFSKPIYLTVSAQLHLEAAAHGLGRVYTLNPVFRAENSRSRLHLSEFHMLEAEQAFVSDLSDLMRLIEDMVTWLSGRMVELAHKDIELASDNQTCGWINSPSAFPVLEYADAIRILEAKGLTDTAAIPGGLSKEQELALVAHCGQIPTFVVNWPRTAKPAFYMKEDQETGQVLAVDLLVPVVGELAGGSVREYDHGALCARCASQHIQHLDWYTDLRQFCGSVPTAGFGLGFERYLQFLCNISNIKDTILFPRWPHNCAM